MAIEPIDLPSAAGLEFGQGDVRHFAQGDEVAVPSLANPTRHLAERDNQMAVKLNEIIEVVNNQEQFVPLPVIRTVLPPSDEIVVTNYRIPAGFESRVLNAAVSATPTSTDVELNVYYASTFGNNTGDNVVSVSNEFTGGVSFYQEGEFIVTLKNKGGVTLEAAASILLTLRPIGGEGSLLVASVIRGQEGVPGPTGPPGPPGTPGTGGAGSPGMVWRSVWAASSGGYLFRDVVSHAFSGSMIAAYFCKVSHAPSNSSNEPPNTSFWDVVVQPASGDAGPPGPASTFLTQFSNGTLRTAANYIPGSLDSTYTSSVYSTPSTSYGFLFNEVAVTNAGTSGMAIATAIHRTCFAGQGTYWFPTTANGAYADYQDPYINCIVASQGTTRVQVSSGTFGGVYSIPLVLSRLHPDGQAFIVEVNGTTPLPVEVQLSAYQLF